MSTDLEQRLRDELHARAGDVGRTPGAGSAVRRAAAVRRRRQLRAGAAIGSAVLAAAVVVGVVAAGGGRPEDLPPALPTGSPTSSPEGLVQVPVSDGLLAQAYELIAAGRPALLASAVLPQSGDTVLVFDGERQLQPDGQAVVYTVTVHDGRLQAGTSTFYRSDDTVVAQPARDGVRRTLVVVTRAAGYADHVEVTTSLPGKDIREHDVALDGGIALVPVPTSESVTRLRLLRGGTAVEDRIPGDFYLPSSVPRPLGRVVVSAGTTQPVQVRTDGTTACRLTTLGMQPPVDVFMLTWNPFDEACATIEPTGLRLLLADDRHYSSVAGVAPRGATVVRLHWRSGDVTDVPVAADEVPAFVDTSGHRPDRLVLAEAVDAAGDVVASARP